MKTFHSRAYYRYFEDYAETSALGADGREHISRVYIGEYYKLDIGGSRRVRRKVLFAGLYIAAFALLISAGVRDVRVNHAVYVAAPTALSLLTLLWLAFPVFSYIFSPVEMVMRTYRCVSVKLKRSALITASLLGLSAAAAVTALFAERIRPQAEEILIPAQLFAAAAMIFYLFLSAKAVTYTKLPPKSEPPQSWGDV